MDQFPGQGFKTSNRLHFPLNGESALKMLCSPGPIKKGLLKMLKVIRTYKIINRHLGNQGMIIMFDVKYAFYVILYYA